MKSDSAATPDQLLARLRAGDQRVFDRLYTDHQREFLHWAAKRHPALSQADLEDCFQEAVITLFENVRSGKLVTLTASLKSYLFGLGKRKCQEQYRRVASELPPVAEPTSPRPDADAAGDDVVDETAVEALAADPTLVDDPFGILETPTDEGRLDRVHRGLRQLSGDCHALLVSFYYHARTLTELADEFGHQDENTSKVRKSQCLSRLRQIVGVKRSS